MSQRLVSIIARIDTVSDDGVEMIPLQHASAAELARTLTQLSENKAAELSADASKVFADERTNSILLSGGKSGRLRLRALITHLDTPISQRRRHQRRLPALRQCQGSRADPARRGGDADQRSAGPGKRRRRRPRGRCGARQRQGGSIATIQAHEDNNALIISAPPAVFRSLQDVIRQLDMRRAQVLIEAVIAEVSEETANELGVQWQLPLGAAIMSSAAPISAAATQRPPATTSSPRRGLNPLGVGNGFNPRLHRTADRCTIGNTKIFQLGALVTALRSNGKNNILSTPSVMTLDNQQAIIKVGQEVPFLTGSYQTTPSTHGERPAPAARRPGIANPFQTIQRKDVGLTLTVTPHINEGDSVKLEIHQEVSSLAPPVIGRVRSGHQQARSADHGADQGRFGVRASAA